jgi:hypothetical protein
LLTTAGPGALAAGVVALVSSSAFHGTGWALTAAVAGLAIAVVVVVELRRHVEPGEEAPPA